MISIQKQADIGIQVASYLNQMNYSHSLSPLALASTQSPSYYSFVSIGHLNQRAKVFRDRATSISNLANRITSRIEKYSNKTAPPIQWIKVDIVTNAEKINYSKLHKLIARTRKNYFRQGISFDTDFSIAFLEQEINGNALIRSSKEGSLQLDDSNINHYLTYREGGKRLLPFSLDRYKDKDIFLFETQSFLFDLESDEFSVLKSGGAENGLRPEKQLNEEVFMLIEKSTHYLANSIKPSGKFDYGYFAPFDRPIGTYNILRHSSSLYSLLEGIEVLNSNELLPAVKRGLEFLETQIRTTKDKLSYVLEKDQHNEIKLGSNATAILAISKYISLTKDFTLLPIAQSLALGILSMQKEDGKFIHVLAGDTLEVKEENRIIYYEGEAVFALLRLYAIDPNPVWLDAAKKSFDYFLANDYYKHHDHWLAYATFEITKYLPNEEYFTFGLKNGFDNLNFIYKRETTFPTFLELTMATYRLVERIKEQKKDYLLEGLDEKKLTTTIYHRIRYQRTGFFFPEVAMYMKNPKRILHGFFIKHHSFRVRIDDVEHYLSGYCQAYQHMTLSQ